MERIYDMVIIGGGPGGYTAALYAARAGLDTLVLEKLSAGGQMNLTHQIDNYPGFDNGVEGFELAQKMLAGAQRFGAETKYSEVTSLNLQVQPRVVETTNGTILARTVIIATGAVPRLLGIAKEQELTGRGVSYCAFCDGMFYRDKTVVVVGGGNTAAAEALQLSRVAKKVILVHRRDTLRATKIYHEPIRNAQNITFLGNHVVTQLLHGDVLTGVKVKDLISGKETLLDADGLFISIGRVPVTQLVTGQLELDEAGYILADESTRTNIAGVYAVGDVRTKALRQVVTATADGAVAIHYAEEYLAETANGFS